MDKPEQTVKVFMADSFLVELARLAEGYGGISAMARYFGVDKANLHKAIQGKRPPSPTLLSRLKAAKRLAYVVCVGGK